MLCSVCNKNTAIIFINKVEDNKTSTEGLCYSCAKKRGLNPMDVIAKNANISEEDLNNMSSQLESLFKDFTENIDSLDPNAIESMENGNPLGGILGMFQNNNNAESDEKAESNTEKGSKKVRIERKPKNNKKKFFNRKNGFYPLLFYGKP